MQLLLLLCIASVAAVGCASTSIPSNPSAAASAGNAAEGRAKPLLLFQECKILPEYPALSRDRRETGTVRIAMNVDAKGLVTKSEIVQSSGFTNFDQVALATLSRCPFLPALKDSEPIVSLIEITYVWKLQ